MKSLEEGLGVLVTGGAGYVGNQLSAKLAAEHHTVVSLYRHKLPQLGENIFPVCSDLSSEELLAAPLRGIKTVVHLAWDQNFIGQTLDQDQTKIPRTNNLTCLAHLLAAMEKAKTKRIIFQSVLGASRTSKDPFLREKYWGEYLCLNSNIEERVIVRGSLLFGRHSKFTESIKNLMRIPGVYPLPKIKEELRPLHVDDLISFLTSLTKVQLNKPFSLIEISGQTPYTLDFIFKTVSEGMGKGGKIALPGVFGRLVFPFLEKDSSSKQKGLVKIGNLLNLGKAPKDYTRLENPLVSLLPTEKMNFEQVIKRESLSHRDGLKAIPPSV